MEPRSGERVIEGRGNYQTCFCRSTPTSCETTTDSVNINKDPQKSLVTKKDGPSGTIPLWFQRYSQDNIFKVKVSTRSKVKSRSHHGVAHLHPPPNVSTKYHLTAPYGFVKGQIKVIPGRCTPTLPTNVPTKYQLPTPYCFKDIVQTRFYRSRSLRQGQRSNQGRTMRSMMLHTYTPYAMSPSTSYTLQFLRYSPDKFFPATSPPEHPNAHRDTMGENNTPTAHILRAHLENQLQAYTKSELNLSTNF